MEQRKDIMTGIIRILILFIVGSIFLAIAGYILSFVIDIIGRIIVFVLQWAVFGGIAWYGYKYPRISSGMANPRNCPKIALKVSAMRVAQPGRKDPQATPSAMASTTRGKSPNLNFIKRYFGKIRN